MTLAAGIGVGIGFLMGRVRRAWLAGFAPIFKGCIATVGAPAILGPVHAKGEFTPPFAPSAGKDGGGGGTIAVDAPAASRSPMNRAPALVALHAAVLLFGFAGLFGKWLALSPLVIVLGRTVVAAAALALVLVARPGPHAGFDVRLIVNGAVLALHWVSFFAAIQVATVAVGLLGFASFPLFVLLLERAMLGRRWSRAEAITAIAVGLGLALLVPEFSFGNRTVQGLAWGVVSGFTFALLAVQNRRLAPGRSAIELAFWQNLLAALCLAPVAALAVPGPFALDGRDVALLLVLGLVCTALAHTVFIASLAVVSAHTASVIAALEPVYGIALAVVLLGEVPGPRTLVGGALIVGAAVAASQRAARQVSSRPAIR